MAQGRAATAAIPNCRWETLPGAAHFPHLEEPERLAQLLEDFIATTAPGNIEDSDWADVLARRARARLRRVA
jgi:hypothetical protein